MENINNVDITITEPVSVKKNVLKGILFYIIQ